MTPLKTHWLELYKPITDHLKLDMRMNLKTKKAGGSPCGCIASVYSYMLEEGPGDRQGAATSTAAC
jgi:hypothetical protein